VRVPAGLLSECADVIGGDAQAGQGDG
jgi:hypothetical protein